MPLLVVTYAHSIQLWSRNVYLRLLKATLEFIWWVDGVLKVNSVSNPTTFEVEVEFRNLGYGYVPVGYDL